jgi:hypothetical protein
MNVLNVLVFYGDNLSVLRDRIAPESVNLFISTRPSTRTPPTMSFSRHHRANSHKRRSRRSGTPGPPRSNVYARKSCCQIGLEQARRPGAVQRLSCVRGLSVSFHAFGLLEQAGRRKVLPPADRAHTRPHFRHWGQLGPQGSYFLKTRRPGHLRRADPQRNRVLKAFSVRRHNHDCPEERRGESRVTFVIERAPWSVKRRLGLFLTLNEPTRAPLRRAFVLQFCQALKDAARPSESKKTASVHWSCTNHRALQHALTRYFLL